MLLLGTGIHLKNKANPKRWYIPVFDIRQTKPSFSKSPPPVRHSPQPTNGRPSSSVAFDIRQTLNSILPQFLFVAHRHSTFVAQFHTSDCSSSSSLRLLASSSSSLQFHTSILDRHDTRQYTSSLVSSMLPLLI